jgi:GNT-I family
MKWFTGWRTGRDAPRSYPIAILSFDRPDYLRRVLKSLITQVSPDDQVILFQDGAYNKYSGRQKADPVKIEYCVKLFRCYFPNGEIHLSDVNLGIAWNYERAERHVFETLSVSAGLFLEDDLYLSPNYLDVIDRLLDIAAADTRIGYVSAYGDFWAARSEQAAEINRIMPMHENWGAALTRQSWMAERAVRLEYLKLVSGVDYSHRDHEMIRKFYHGRGWVTDITSQDCARWIACLERGAVRITTRACHAKYIGEHGEHFTRKLYRQGRFAGAKVYNGAIHPLHPPTDAEIETWLAAETVRFKGNSSGFSGGHPLR